MESSPVMRRRRMVRHDTDEPLAPEVVERVLDAALRAPSPGSCQGWAFLVLTEPADRARSWPYVPTRATQAPTTMDAPLVVVPLAHEAASRDRYARSDEAAADVEEWPVPFGYVDTVGHRHPDLAPQDATSTAERRRRDQDAVHRGRS